MFLLYMHKSQDLTFFENYTLVPLNTSHLYLQASRFWTTPVGKKADHRELQYEKQNEKLLR